MNNPPCFNVSCADEGDITEIAKLERYIFSDFWSETNIGASVLSPQYVTLTAKLENGELAGYGILLLGPYEAEILRIAAAPDCRRLGIGEAVLKHLIYEADKRRLSTIFLEVRESNTAAVQLYLKNGFCKYSVRKNYYKSPSENAVLMCLAKETL